MSNPAAAAPNPRAKIPVELIIAAGCAIAILSFGPRSSIGAFQRDVLVDNGWTRDVFSLAIALQNLLWGLGQPLAGGFFVHRDCFHLGACRGFGAPYNVFH